MSKDPSGDLEKMQDQIYRQQMVRLPEEERQKARELLQRVIERFSNPQILEVLRNSVTHQDVIPHWFTPQGEIYPLAYVADTALPQLPNIVRLLAGLPQEVTLFLLRNLPSIHYTNKLFIYSSNPEGVFQSCADLLKPVFDQEQKLTREMEMRKEILEANTPRSIYGNSNDPYADPVEDQMDKEFGRTPTKKYETARENIKFIPLIYLTPENVCDEPTENEALFKRSLEFIVASFSKEARCYKELKKRILRTKEYPGKTDEVRLFGTILTFYEKLSSTAQKDVGHILYNAARIGKEGMKRFGQVVVTKPEDLPLPQLEQILHYGYNTPNKVTARDVEVYFKISAQDDHSQYDFIDPLTEQVDWLKKWFGKCKEVYNAPLKRQETFMRLYLTECAEQSEGKIDLAIANRLPELNIALFLAEVQIPAEINRKKLERERNAWFAAPHIYNDSDSLISEKLFGTRISKGFSIDEALKSYEDLVKEENTFLTALRNPRYFGRKNLPDEYNNALGRLAAGINLELKFDAISIAAHEQGICDFVTSVAECTSFRGTHEKWGIKHLKDSNIGILSADLSTGETIGKALLAACVDTEREKLLYVDWVVMLQDIADILTTERRATWAVLYTKAIIETAKAKHFNSVVFNLSHTSAQRSIWRHSKHIADFLDLQEGVDYVYKENHHRNITTNREGFKLKDSEAEKNCHYLQKIVDGSFVREGYYSGFWINHWNPLTPEDQGKYSHIPLLPQVPGFSQREHRRQPYINNGQGYIIGLRRSTDELMERFNEKYGKEYGIIGLPLCADKT